MKQYATNEDDMISWLFTIAPEMNWFCLKRFLLNNYCIIVLIKLKLEVHINAMLVAKNILLQTF